MFHSPSSETKQQSDSTRTQLQRADFSARAPVAPGYAATRGQLARLHSTYGNQAVLRMLSQSAPAIQTKLAVNKPGDKFEQEADRVADQVMRMTSAPAPSIQRKCSGCEEEEKLQRKCAECEEEEKKTGLQRKEAGTRPQFAPPSVHAVLNSPGRPLDPATRAFMEPRFGHDFSQVQVHTDARAADSARVVNALAYTVGRIVVFGAGQYLPQSNSGRRLIAHELAHVIQQSGSQPTLQAQPAQMNPKGDNITKGFSCGDFEMQDPGFDNSKSCCNETTLTQLKDMVLRVYNALDTAVQRAEAGASVDRLLTQHFGPKGPSERDAIIGNIKKTLGVALEYLPKHTFLCRPGTAIFGCGGNELARSTTDSNITVCEGEIKDQFWETILHEMFHVSGVASLPDYSKADAEERESGMFETYYSDDPAGSQNPAFQRYPSSEPLCNADSYRKFVVAISAPNFSNEPKPLRFLPTPALGAGAMLPGFQPAIWARLAFIPSGERVLHFITPGAVGVWMPKLGAVPITDRNAAQPRGYAGGELGLDAVSGIGSVTGVFDLAAGVGAVWTRGGTVDFGALVRTSVGVRFGSRAFGASLNADLAQIYNFALREQRNDVIVGLSTRLHLGGHSGQPH